MNSILIITYKFHFSDLIKLQFFNCLSQISSQVAETRALYSISALDLATTLCFLLFQEIKMFAVDALVLIFC